MPADLLDRYLTDERARSFAWGTADCLQFPAGWGAWLGFDVSRWRGLCDDEAGARAVVARYGGAAAIMSDVFGSQGDVGAARRGDVGIIGYDGWHVGLICTGEMWCLRHAVRGIRFGRITPEAVWHVDTERRCPA